MTDDLVKRLRDINRNYDLARGIHHDLKEEATAARLQANKQYGFHKNHGRKGII